MDVSGEYFIPMPRQRVWSALNDPAIVRHCIPGCRLLERISPTAMRATIQAKVGPLTSTYTGILSQSDMVEPASVTLTAEGDGDAGAGHAKGTSRVTLAEENGGTRLRYVAHAEIGGKLAAVRGRVIDTAVKHMADQFFGTFAARAGESGLARAEHAVEDAARDVEERAEVAAGKGFLGGPYVWGLIALAVVIVALLIFR